MCKRYAHCAWVQIPPPAHPRMNKFLEMERTEERRKRMEVDKEQKIKELESLMNTVAGKKILLEVN